MRKRNGRYILLSITTDIRTIIKERPGRIREVDEEYYKNHKERLHSLKIQLNPNPTKGVHSTREWFILYIEM